MGRPGKGADVRALWPNVLAALGADSVCSCQFSPWVFSIECMGQSGNFVRAT